MVTQIFGRGPLVRAGVLPCLVQVLTTLALIAGLALAGPAEAQSTRRSNYAMAPLVVRDDPGGRVDHRAAEIAKLRKSGQPVELRGECFSACTMYLALPNACTARNTMFGFHGPSYYGAPLPKFDFEYWSKIIASHYPPKLAQWYMTKARYKTNRMVRLSGAELIKFGIAECGAAPRPARQTGTGA
ncbi:hypothetical protein [Frigidibacter oleivorans]|uniref:hypothetical protein n=1 Tax=Frigidibacter oleivorans TaxID=2487129 RepID=UPI000F8C9588|nr:hypothetical protein [Frigidibacter oleivorans]